MSTSPFSRSTSTSPVWPCLLGVCLILGFVGTVLAQDALPPPSWRDHFTSSRIEDLKRRIATGNTSTDAFWRDVEREGTPLVEASSPTATHQVVTFLWRGSPNTTHNAVVNFGPAWIRPSDDAMRNIPGTDVWYLTSRFPRGARFIYQLSPNDPLDSPALGVWKNSNLQADPLNPNRWLCAPTASAKPCNSRVELPGAVPQPWIVRQGDTPSGKVEGQQFKSALLNDSSR